MAVQATPRGTRPKNRREQIRTAAILLFHERGYEQVSVADIAAAVNVGPSALYRHYSGKSELLFDAIDQSIDAFAALVVDLPQRDLPGIAAAAASSALTNRSLGALWQREARNLPPEQQQRLRLRLREAVGIFASALWAIRPELDESGAAFLAATSVNAMSSLSFHRLELPEGEFEELLTDLMLRLLSHRFAGSEQSGSEQAGSEQAGAHPEPAAVPVDRREQIAAAAAQLFAARGFEAVSTDDIGAAVGIAGPSIYHHFANKQEILFEVLGRGYDRLQDALSSAPEDDPTPEQRLRRISDSYVALTLGHTAEITVLIAESRNLGPDYSEMARLTQLGYIGQWVELIGTIRPDEDVTVSRIKVQAAQMTANSISRSGYLRARPTLRHDLSEICWLLLQ